MSSRDFLWPSARYATALQRRLDAKHFSRWHRDFTYRKAGHGLANAIPYLPTLSFTDFGGSAGADEAAKVDLWPRILDFMDRLPER